MGSFVSLRKKWLKNVPRNQNGFFCVFEEKMIEKCLEVCKYSENLNQCLEGCFMDTPPYCVCSNIGPNFFELEVFGIFNCNYERETS